MRLEHCESCGHDIPFTTPNYQITTTPKKEWGIVVEGEHPAQEDMRHGRTIPDLALAHHWAAPDDLVLSEMESSAPPPPAASSAPPPPPAASSGCHSPASAPAQDDDPTRAAPEERMRAARLVTAAGLQRSEVAAVILYTGPMVCAPCPVILSHPPPNLYWYSLTYILRHWALSRSTTSSTAFFADSQTIGTGRTATAATSSLPPSPSSPASSRRLPASPMSGRAPSSIAASAAVWSSPTPSSAQTPWAVGASPNGASSAPRATRRWRSPTPTPETARPTPPRPSRSSSKSPPPLLTAAPPSTSSPSTRRCAFPLPHWVHRLLRSSLRASV
jgi:hypothetical protein